jgi:hypothetical protein
MKQQTLQFTLVDYDIEEEIIKPTFGNTGKRFVDEEVGCQKFKKQASDLMHETAKYYKFFKNNTYQTDISFDNEQKHVTFQLTGIPELEYYSLNGVEDWRDTIEFFIVDKGHHEQFKNADLCSTVIIKIFFKTR